MATDVLEGWTRTEFTAEGRTRIVYRRGSGPGVVVVHEVPGITPEVVAFANDVVRAGFTVVMPSLLGEPGRPMSTGYGLRSVVRLCVAREFTTWGLGRTSPIVGWLRALARSVHATCGGPGVGAIGMCFSGGFALGMMVDPVLVAPVLSQPSLPLSMLGARRAADVNLSPEDVAAVRDRAAAGCDVLGLRYRDDGLVGTRFETLGALLGAQFVAVELPSPTKRAHSVLTMERDEASVMRVLTFLRDRLLSTVD